MTRPKKLHELAPDMAQRIREQYGITTTSAIAEIACHAATMQPERPTKPMRARQAHEDAAQMAVIRWADAPDTRERFPSLQWLFHPANGGARHPAVAAKMKAMGVRRGVPDLLLPVSRGTFSGLAIELKVWQGSATAPIPEHPERYRMQPRPEQVDWMAHLEDEGWMVRVCWGAQDAIDTITEYLSPRPTPSHP